MLWGLGLGREDGGLGSQVVAPRFGVFSSAFHFFGICIFFCHAAVRRIFFFEFGL